ncbi:MAG: hypothetical protein ACI9MF_001077 [Gammaproteobacteria bacterium]|jgi:hypothetical protein
MKSLPRQQTGASMIANIITIAVVGYGIYVGIQYVPQFIESKSIGSILSSIEADHRLDPLTSESGAEAKVIKLLQINERDDLVDSFKVRERNNSITITFSYDRELKLGYKTKKMHYEIARTLK